MPKFLKILSSFFLIAAAVAVARAAEDEEGGPRALERTVQILGWTKNGENLAYREDTAHGSELFSRVVVIHPTSAKLLAEHVILQNGDTADIVSVRENNLRVLLEKDGYEMGHTAQFFIGTGKRGFLTPNGQYLIEPAIDFKLLPGQREFYQLQIHLTLHDLRSGKKQELVVVTLDNLDGEHAFISESFAAVFVQELQFGPKENSLALVLTEKRRNFFTQGVVPVELREIPDLMVLPEETPPQPSVPEVVYEATPTPTPTAEWPEPRFEPKPTPLPAPVLAPTPVPTPVAPKAASMSPAKEWPSDIGRVRSPSDLPSSDFTPADTTSAKERKLELSSAFAKSMNRYFSPDGGQAESLSWKPLTEATATDGQYQALLSTFEACNQTFAAQIHIVQPSLQRIFEAPIASGLPSDDLSLRFSSDRSSLDVALMNETLRSFSLASVEFQTMDTHARAFALQTGSYSSRATADAEVARLCASGHPAYVLSTTDTSGITRYRVRIGRFSTDARAKRYLAEKKDSTTLSNAIVTKF